jgi:hypothetical protein
MAEALSKFVGSPVTAPPAPSARRPGPEQNAWRRVLTYSQLTDIEQVAGEELRRLGYK